MAGLDVKGKRVIQTCVGGVMTLLLIFTSFIKSMEVLGYQMKISYPIMIGALLHITEITPLGELEGEDWTAFLFYTAVLTVIFAVCVLMTVWAWMGKGRIIYLTGNILVILLFLILNMTVSSFNSSYALGLEAFKMGTGYWIALVLALVGLVLGILNLIFPWSGKKAMAGRRRYAGAPNGPGPGARGNAAPYYGNRPVGAYGAPRGGMPSQGRVAPPMRQAGTNPYRPSGPAGNPAAGYTGGNPAAGYTWNTPTVNYAGRAPSAGYAGNTPTVNYAGRNPTTNYAGRTASAGYAGSNPAAGYAGSDPASVGSERTNDMGKVKYHLRNTEDGGGDAAYFRRGDGDDLL